MKYAMEHCTIEGIETYILTPESAKSLLNDAGELSRLHLQRTDRKQLTEAEFISMFES